MDKYPKVTYTHYRVPDDSINPYYEGKIAPPPKRGRPRSATIYKRGSSRKEGWGDVSPRGGKTICRIDFGGGRYAIGEAVCSMSDNFSYKTGRTLALARAMELLDPVSKIAVAEAL